MAPGGNDFDTPALGREALNYVTVSGKVLALCKVSVNSLTLSRQLNLEISSGYGCVARNMGIIYTNYGGISKKKWTYKVKLQN